MNEPILYYRYLANTLPEIEASKENKALKDLKSRLENLRKLLKIMAPKR